MEVVCTYEQYGLFCIQLFQELLKYMYMHSFCVASIVAGWCRYWVAYHPPTLPLHTLFDGNVLAAFLMIYSSIA